MNKTIINPVKSGLGYVLDDKNNFSLLFEVEGMAQDKQGNPAPAGVKISFGQCTKIPDNFDQIAQDAVKNIMEKGLPGIENKKFAPITLDKYLEEYAD